MVRTTQSIYMAYQMPSTPRLSTRANTTPSTTRNTHMEEAETVMVKRVSPAARSACGSSKAAGQNTMPTSPWVQMMMRA